MKALVSSLKEVFDSQQLCSKHSELLSQLFFLGNVLIKNLGQD